MQDSYRSRKGTMTDWLHDELRRLQHSSLVTALSTSGQAAGLPQSNNTIFTTISDARRSHLQQGQQSNSWPMHVAQPSNQTQTTPSTLPLWLNPGLPPANSISSNQLYDQIERRNVGHSSQTLNLESPTSLATTYSILAQGTVHPIYQPQGVLQRIQSQSLPWPLSYPSVTTLSTARTLSDLNSEWSGQVPSQAMPTTNLTPRTENSHLTNSNSGQSCGHASLFPAVVSCQQDSSCLSLHQAFLREQLEFFQANADDVAIRTRGRTRPIRLGQVGLRCRHCAHVSPAQRQKGSVYFPISVNGLYQAGQNLSTSHIQCGVCIFMSDGIKTKFADLIPSKKNVSTGGRRYWATCAKQMGLVDTEHGIYSGDCTPPGVVVLDSESKNEAKEQALNAV